MNLSVGHKAPNLKVKVCSFASRRISWMKCTRLLKTKVLTLRISITLGMIPGISMFMTPMGYLCSCEFSQNSSQKISTVIHNLVLRTPQSDMRVVLGMT